MINIFGPYLLILTINNGNTLAIQEMSSWESCQAAITQLEPLDHIRGYCIAKETKENKS
jgi:hypothetical protein